MWKDFENMAEAEYNTHYSRITSPKEAFMAGVEWCATDQIVRWIDRKLPSVEDIVKLVELEKSTKLLSAMMLENALYLHNDIDSLRKEVYNIICDLRGIPRPVTKEDKEPFEETMQRVIKVMEETAAMASKIRPGKEFQYVEQSKNDSNESDNIK